MNKKALLFDLDGTLINSIDLILECLEYAHRHHYGDVPSEKELRSIIGKPLFSYFRQRCSSDDEATLMIATYREYQKSIISTKITLYPTVEPTLQVLKEQNILLGIVTSKSAEGIAVMRPVSPTLFDYFDILVNCDDTERHKPHPDPLHYAAKKLGISEDDCAYIGDTTHDMAAANEAGITAIGITWGVDNEETLRSYTPRIISCMSQLLPLVL